MCEHIECPYEFCKWHPEHDCEKDYSEYEGMGWMIPYYDEVPGCTNYLDE